MGVKSTQNIRDQHLWMSIFMRPPQSPFSRTQRLTCALSFILGCMLTNIMFYQVAADSDMDVNVANVR